MVLSYSIGVILQHDVVAMMYCWCYKSHLSVPGGEATDSRSVLQHQGPVGNPQEFPAPPPRDWPWPVWKGL